MSAKNKGLGRGLGAIFEDNFYEDRESDKQNPTLPLTLIDTNPNQPRKCFAETELSELAASIEQNGLIQPIIVRKIGERYEIIAGERRFRAVKQLGRSEIPAIVVEADDAKAAKYSLIENLQREDLNPCEEATAFRTLTTEYGLTQEEAAAQVGKSRSAVANSMRLLELPENILELMAGGELSAGHGKALLMLFDRGQMTELAEKAANGGMTVRQLEDAVRKANRKPKKAEDDPVGDEIKVDYLKVIEDRFTGITGRRFKINKKKSGLKTIQVEYRDDADLEELLKKLAGEDIFEGM